MTDKAAAALAELTKTFENEIALTKAALDLAKIRPNPGYVFVWPDYWMGVTIKGTVTQACAVHRATVTTRNDRRTIFNGHGIKATLMPLPEALEGSLKHSIETLANITGHPGITTLATGEA